MKITKLQKSIVDKHLQAMQSGNFDYRTSETQKLSKDAFISELKQGKTFEYIHDQVSARYVSITSLLMANRDTFNHLSEAYKRGYRNGFKLLLTNLNTN